MNAVPTTPATRRRDSRLYRVTPSVAGWRLVPVRQGGFRRSQRWEIQRQAVPDRGAAEEGVTSPATSAACARVRPNEMKRRLLNLLTPLSLVLCVAAVVLWVRSFWRLDEVGGVYCGRSGGLA